MVKLVKKAIKLAIGESVLSFTELQTVLFEAADLVNERPLNISQTRGNDDLDFDYLCPNQLLLGRASGRVKEGLYLIKTNLTSRVKYIKEVTDKFWKDWMKLVSPSLVLRPKWHVVVRNLKIGDVVMIADQNAVKGEYKLGLVSDVYNDDRGRVRHVQVSYKLSNAVNSKHVSFKRDVRKLVLILPVEEQVAQDEVGGV